MAGHSHSANIAHRKNAQDAARGKIFQKLSKEIFVAAQKGFDPEMNPALKLAISKAKAKNMPKDNIERAISKAKGDKNSNNFTETIFNATLSGGVSFIVTTLSDNLNRTRSNMTALFNKQNASLGKTGQIPFVFDHKGIIEFSKGELSEDDLMMVALENGAQEVETTDETFVLISNPEDFSQLKKALEDSFKIEEFLQCEILYLPNTYAEVSEEKQQKLLEFIDKLKDDDDVQDVYHNLDI
ncbi:YebC/PmpR family DNA-binding transcriptional regulator [Mycoplasmopsis synoviae]|uniref:Probable transcriptional regulatory protein NCTC10124_00802 n=1 Tax=Mycoplasmopsis synoviae TaxID=2109 RepID=A0A3B0PUA7_MYCSY|nr:YebC/PmpR family DNA-binding transcriptional regulator [Mycoplasmopsis synoviae]AKB11111.1 transcriptional regulator [Mycoplasmopsis synoviae ATCC 25204]ULL02144.1 YebC/PmpR family DNA-binding transcriptional regulator [Mycoplasmopsis synoviae]UZW64145.1 YebC/PmpR family DNA-binding transcriptional regulator [Mycoplasmopsis synoviae]SYV93073.1 UPF0082 protein MCRO_0552 [Mycoplasmopsis synoviae]